MNDRLQQVLDDLRHRGDLTGDLPPTQTDHPVPVQVRILITMAAWLAATLLALAMGAIGGITSQNGGFTFVGLMLAAGGVVVLRLPNPPQFIEEMGAPITLAGGALLLFGLGNDHHLSSYALAIAIVLYLAGSGNVLRSVCAIVACFAIVDLTEPEWYHHSFNESFVVDARNLCWGIVAWALWRFDAHWMRAGLRNLLRPLATVGVCAWWLIATCDDNAIRHMSAFSDRRFIPQLGTHELMFVIPVCVIILDGLRRKQPPIREAWPLALPLIVALFSPPCAVGYSLTLLGAQTGRRTLLITGIAGLVLGFSWLYYSLAWSLLAKSAVLTATGVALLAVYALRRRQQKEAV